MGFRCASHYLFADKIVHGFVGLVQPKPCQIIGFQPCFSQLIQNMFTDQWLAMLIAIPAALIARACAVGVCGLITTPLKHGVGPAWQILLFWGGLRGAIAVALVLSLPVELPYWYTIQAMVFSVVLFSLLVQGTTNSKLISRYGTEQNS